MTEKNVVTAIRDALHDEMADDDRIVLLGEDVGNRGGVFRISAGWMQEFGEQRVIDTPLAESGLVGVAIGMAMHGMLPVAEIQFADFIHPAFDQIVSEAARIRYRSNGAFSCPLVIRARAVGASTGRSTTRNRSKPSSPTCRGSRSSCRPHPPTRRACCAPRSPTLTRCCSSSTRRPIARSPATCRTSGTSSRSRPT